MLNGTDLEMKYEDGKLEKRPKFCLFDGFLGTTKQHNRFNLYHTVQFVLKYTLDMQCCRL